MNYSEAIQFLYGLQMFGANLGLERAEKLAALAGNPERQLRFIHVAGTNGKGSTCAMLESVYRAAGLRVGLFTSPHLVSFRERMQINRALISQADLIQLVAEIKPLLKEFPGANHPTMFEVVTVMALKFFADQKCDLVIWETGLGGRLDATNIVTPLASVITNIAFDHTQWLGDTLEKIALEKAGIIKPGLPVVTAETQTEALGVIENVAREKGAALKQIKDSKVKIQNLPLVGGHQNKNASLALAVVGVLEKQIPVSEIQIETGLATVNWPGRLQLIERGRQKILLDGAHNLAGVDTLCAAISSKAAGTAKPAIIVGMLADKDWQAMCGKLAPLAGKIFTVPVDSARTVSAEELAAAFCAANPAAEIRACNSLPDALTAAAQEKFIVIAGSLYLIGEALAQLDPAFADVGDERGLNEWSAKR